MPATFGGFAPNRRLLVFNPMFEIGSLEPPLPTNVKRRKLAALGHRIDGLLADLQQSGHLRERENGVRNGPVLSRFESSDDAVWRDNLDERFAANKMAIFAVAAE